MFRSSLFDYNYFYPSIFKIGEYDAEEFYNKIFDNYYELESFENMKIELSDYNSEVIPILMSVGYERNEPNGVIVVLFDTEKIKKYMNGLDSEAGDNFYIIDNENNLVMSLYESNIRKVNVEFEDNSINENFMVLKEHSSISGWNYVLVQNKDKVFNEINKLKRNAYIIILLVLLIGLIISLIATKFNSKPVELLINNNQALNEQMKRQKPYIRQAFLERWLSGRYKNDEELESISGMLKGNYKGLYYSVFMINFNIQYNVLEKIDSISVNQLELKRLIIKDLLKADLIKEENMHDVESDKIAIICIGNDDSIEEFENSILKKIKECVKILNDNNISNVVFTVGGSYNQMSGITSSMVEAIDASLNITNLDNQIICYKEIEVSKKGYYYPLELETRLYNSVISGDEKQVEIVLRNILSKNVLQRNLNSNMMRLFIYEIWGTLAKVSERYINNHKEVTNYINSAYCEVELISDIEKINHLKITLMKVCEIINQKNNDNDQGVIQNIKEYILDNYSNPSFGLVMISEQFNLSEAYISNIFKEYYGETFMNYIQNLRMNKAEELLSKTKVPIKKIVKEVGYNSSNTFGKAFKRRHGISASEYRMKSKQ